MRIASNYEFDIIEPSSIGSLRAQMALFYSCDLIAGEYTSALHNSIFARQGTKVISFNFINDVQNLIGLSRQQSIRYLVAEDGPVGWNAGKDYEVEEEKFESILKEFCL
jgi:O-antigen biosynthesis protein WbqL